VCVRPSAATSRASVSGQHEMYSTRRKVASSARVDASHPSRGGSTRTVSTCRAIQVGQDGARLVRRQARSSSQGKSSHVKANEQLEEQGWWVTSIDTLGGMVDGVVGGVVGVWWACAHTLLVEARQGRQRSTAREGTRDVL
jgi:hypothetical protein